MKISLANLGVLKHAEFELGNLTLICGDNNTGKTYATYALFGFLSNWRRLLSVDIPRATIDALLNDGLARIDVTPHAKQAIDIIQAGCEKYIKELPNIFASKPNRFERTEFRIMPDIGTPIPAPESAFLRNIGSKDETLFSFKKPTGDPYLAMSLQTPESQSWHPDLIRILMSGTVIELLFQNFFPRPFIASAERTGATMFRTELDADPRQIDLFQTRDPDYPLPVNENIDFIRRIEKVAKRTSFIAEEHAYILEEFADVIGGNYLVDDNNTIYFRPTHRKTSLTMDESSSAVRSLLVIGLYLRHVARPGDLLMVDEPELNLHPRNQRRIARLFARLVNLGIRVFATTHSDYIVKELNTLIMLNQDKPHLRRIAEEEGYRREEILSSDQIRVYIAERSKARGSGMHDCTLVPTSIDPELGIEARSFDETINKMNEIQDAIEWGDDE